MDDPQPEAETGAGGGTRYVKVRTVGKGAFGTAVLYRKEPEGSLVVIKQVPVLELSATERARALNEARVLALLSHRNVVRYLGSWERDGCLLLEMEFAGGGTLAQFLAARAARNAALSERRALTLFAQVASAIRHMHAHSVLHRDLKTENIFLTKDNVVKVGDFGISKVMGTQVQAETVLGTPYYLSPEMCEGLQYDQKSDVWALGCVLYELLALRRAFSAPSLPALVRRIVAADYPPPPTRYSAGTRGLLSGLLQTDPGARPSANLIEDQLLPPLQAAANLSSDADSLDGAQGPYARSVVYELRASGCFVSLTPVPLPARAALRELAVSRTHCVALTQEQVVFTWDVVDWRAGGGASFSAGLESWRKPQHQPQCADTLTGLGITRVGAGDGFSVFASDSGAVLTCGDGAEGCLGHGDYSHCVRPRLVEKLLAADVVALAVGPSHVLALGGDGCLHAWGRGKHGRLGLGHQQDALLPAAVPLPEGAVVRSVHAGPDCSAVVSTAGELLLAGDNSAGKLASHKGLRTQLPGWLGGTGRGPWLRFRAVRLPEPVRDVWLAEDHIVALTDTGKILALGDGAPGPGPPAAGHAQDPRTFTDESSDNETDNSSLKYRRIGDLRTYLKSKEEKRAQEEREKASSSASSSTSTCASPIYAAVTEPVTPMKVKVENEADTSYLNHSDATILMTPSTPFAPRQEPSPEPERATSATTVPLHTGLLSAVDGFDWENVYTLGETALHYKSLPPGTLGQASTVGRKVSCAQYSCMIKMNSLTVAACVNATGAHQLPLLVVGKHPDPRCMKHVRGDLSVVYKSHNPAWLTARIGQDWLDNHFRPEVERRQHATGKAGKVLLLLENRAALRKLVSPENIEIRFLPRGETILKRCLGKPDLLTRLKRGYRSRLLELLCSSQRASSTPAELGIVDLFYADFDLMDAIRLLQDAWEDMSLRELNEVWLPAPAQNVPSGAPGTFSPTVSRPMGTFMTQWWELVEAEEKADLCPKNVINIVEETEHGEEEAEVTYSFETIWKWAQKMPDEIRKSVDSLCNEFYEKYFYKAP